MTSIHDLSATGLVPIFPLPEMCLLPGEVLPLYLFEPRYRKMYRDAIETDRLIAMGRFQPGWEDVYHGNPPVYPCMGVGEITAHRERPDGTVDIVLKGVARVRLREVIRETPYRLGRVDDLPECVSDPLALDQQITEIERIVSDCAGEVNPDGGQLDGFDLDHLAGRLSSVINGDPDLKQRILEADDRVERFRLLLQPLQGHERLRQLERMMARLRPSNVHAN